MMETPMFLSGVGMTIVMSLAVVFYLRNHVHTILIDLCGTAERAGFWTAFSNVTLVLVPLIFALRYRPDADDGAGIVFQFSGHLAVALIGLVASVLILGLVLSAYIPKGAPPIPSAQEKKAAA